MLRPLQLRGENRFNLQLSSSSLSLSLSSSNPHHLHPNLSRSTARRWEEPGRIFLLCKLCVGLYSAAVFFLLFQDIMAEVDAVIEEVVGAEVRAVADGGASYAKAALM